MDIFATRLKELRLTNDYTMQALGEKLGVGKSAIAAYESGEKKPPISRLKEIAEIMGVSTDFLLGNTEDPINKEMTRNLAVLLKEPNDFHYNGIPLSEDDIKLFKCILERMLIGPRNKNN
ncbi:helix-turn-helix domain-containing protein [Peribacillus sp. NPDC101480]|uniref:helix-turn-helix domain-containing protein n=1 Tax=Peribacillus sp. NPDC101480 TaxID=3390620 RepID=UPI003CFF8863